MSVSNVSVAMNFAARNKVLNQLKRKQFDSHFHISEQNAIPLLNNTERMCHLLSSYYIICMETKCKNV